jgi:hypothetical protein
MTPTIDKKQALDAYAGNASALARALQITPQAIYQWPDGPILELHALKLWFVLRPEYFQSLAAKASAAAEGEPTPDRADSAQAA